MATPLISDGQGVRLSTVRCLWFSSKRNTVTSRSHAHFPLQLSPKYLHTNSTSHTWPFSAIAELIGRCSRSGTNSQLRWIRVPWCAFQMIRSLFVLHVLCCLFAADNAYDPDVDASQMWIDVKRYKGVSGHCLIFADNGAGMNPEKLHKMLRWICGFNSLPGASTAKHQFANLFVFAS